MRETTKTHGMTGAVLAAVIVAVGMLLLAGGLLLDYFGEAPDVLAAWLTVICALLLLAVAVGVVAALIQRWREVRGGEEDEARKY